MSLIAKEGGKDEVTHLNGNLGMVRDFQDNIDNNHLVHDIFQCVGNAQPHEAAADFLLDVATVAIQIELHHEGIWIITQN